MAVVVQNAKSYLDVVILVLKNPNEFPVSAKTFNGHHYYLRATPMFWPAAKQFCESVGGHLVTIADDAENEFVVGLFKGMTQETGCHIGLIKEGTTLKWITGEVAHGTLWSRIKWDNGNVGGMWVVSGDGKGAKPGDWFFCDSSRPFVIEWDR